ncbi:MAG: hypothetical protein M3Z03_13285, partial [Actinomycetota bacterium]|nr:hypothetical protein [Actinomycetota bacterium]
IEVARIINQSRPDLPTAARFLLADRISYLGHATPLARLFGAGERAQVLSRFEASNARVARRFARRSDRPLFADPVPADPALDADEVQRRTSLALTDLLLDLVRGQDAAWRQLQAAELDHAYRGEVLRRLAEDERVPGPALDDALAGAHDESHGDHGS